MNQAPERFFQLRTYPTPDHRDIIFMEMVDSVLPANQQWAYGDLHEDQTQYPDYELVLVEPAPKNPGWTMRWYASKRVLQDEYNFDTSSANLGSTRFNTVVRAYVFRREDEFSPRGPAMGSHMPDAPEGMFGDSGGSGFLANYLLADKEQRKTGDEHIDSRFVLELRTYIERTTMTEINADGNFGSPVSKVTTLYYSNEVVVGSTSINALFANHSNAFWGVRSDGTQADGSQLSANWFAVVVTSSLDAILAAFRRTMAGFTDVALPDVLTGITIQWNEADSIGVQSTVSGFYGEWANAIRANGNLGDSVRADASASVQPEFYFDIQSPDGRGIKCTHHTFYLKQNNVTHANVLAITGGSIWPKFRAVAHNIAWKGQKVSVSAMSSASGSLACQESADGYISKDLTETSGQSFDVGLMSGSKSISPTIHGLIVITDYMRNQTASATAHVHWPTYGNAVYLGETVKIPETTVAASEATRIAYAEVSPDFLPATSPSVIPSSGIYLMDDLKVQASQFPNWMIITATTINAADLP